jgi:simple sugar transport system permease protein
LKNEENKQDIGNIVLEELNKPAKEANGWEKIGRSLLIPALAVLTGMLIGAILIVVTSTNVYAAFGKSFGDGIMTALTEVGKSYGALLEGSFIDPVRLVNAIKSGDALSVRQAVNPLLEDLVVMTPYIFAGLACALGFRAGLFNIGVEGQLFIGAAASCWVGFGIKGLPAYVHMPLAFLAGALGGAFWAFIPGLLKAYTGGHEVINTIMMNYIAFRLTDWLLGGPMNRPGSGGMPISPMIEKSAYIPQFFQTPIRFHLGFFIALIFAYLVYWLLFKTKWGLTMRTVGANPRAARYAGMDIKKNTIIAMSLSGALAGMAGAVQILAVNHSMALGLSSGYGFDSIALALIGNNNPVGVLLASLLFGILRNGATRMMVVNTIPIDIVSIIQALILMFVAAPAIIRAIYRIRLPKEAGTTVTLSGWGGNK